MEQNKIDMFIMKHDEYFSAQGKVTVRQKLEMMPETDSAKLDVLEFKSPTTTLIFAWLLAGFGINGFYVKKIGWGVTMLILNIVYMLFLYATIMNMMYASYDRDVIMFATTMTSIIATVLCILWIIGIVKARKWTQNYNLVKFLEVIQ